VLVFHRGMPRTSTIQSLERRIHDIITRAAHEISAVARRELSDDIRKLLGAAGATPATTRGAAATPAHAPKASRRGGRRGRRGPNESTIEKVLDFIKSTPGLRSEQIAKQLGGDVKSALAKLRAAGKVKTSGARRATTYASA
jgi:hypothetical protein